MIITRLGTHQYFTGSGQSKLFHPRSVSSSMLSMLFSLHLPPPSTSRIKRMQTTQQNTDCSELAHKSKHLN